MNDAMVMGTRSGAVLSTGDTDTEMQRLKKGDPGAFDALLARYQNRLFRYLCRLLGNEAQAEDIFQQTWLSVMTKLSRYDERRPFEPWLFAIARNLAIDHLRRARPESLDEEGASLREPTGNDPSPLEQLLEREQKSVLSARLAGLPFVYREALTLRFEEEMPFNEIAQLLDCPLSTAKSRVARGLALLRRKGAIR